MPNSIVMDEARFAKVLDLIFNNGRKLGWHRVPAKTQTELADKLGKVYPDQSLLVHSLNSLSICQSIVTFLTQHKALELSKEDYQILLLSCFFHDIGKVKTLLGHRWEGTPALIDEAFEKLGLDEFFQIETSKIFAHGITHQGHVGDSFLFLRSGKFAKGELSFVQNFVKLCDLLASLTSMDNLHKAEQLLSYITGSRGFWFTYYNLSALHGVISLLLHNCVEEYFQEGYGNQIHPILYSPTATVFLVKGKININKKQADQKIFSKLLKKLKVETDSRADHLFNTPLIQQNPRFGLWIDPLLYKFVKADKVISEARRFISQISSRVSSQTKLKYEKKLKEKFAELGYDTSYEVILVSRLIKYFVRYIRKGNRLGLKEAFDELLTMFEIPNEERGFITDEVFLAGYTFEKVIEGRKIKEYPPVEAIRLAVKILADIANKLEKKQKFIDNIIKDEFGLDFNGLSEELERQISQTLIFDPRLGEGFLDFDFSPKSYIRAKMGGSTSKKKNDYVCISCNYPGMGLRLSSSRGGFETKFFTNRNVGSQRLERRWICSVCLFESFIRGLMTPYEWAAGEKRIFHYLFPEIVSSRSVMKVVKTAADEVFYGDIRIQLSPKMKNVITDEPYEEQDLFTEAKRASMRAYLTPDPHFLVLENRFLPKDGQSAPDTRVWIESLAHALILQNRFAMKDLVCVTLVPPTLPTASVELEHPNIMVKRFLQEVTKRSGKSAFQLKIGELDHFEKVIFLLFFFAWSRFKSSNKTPNVIGIINKHIFPGSTLYFMIDADEECRKRAFGIMPKSTESKYNVLRRTCQFIDRIKLEGVKIE